MRSRLVESPVRMVRCCVQRSCRPRNTGPESVSKGPHPTLCSPCGRGWAVGKQEEEVYEKSSFERPFASSSVEGIEERPVIRGPSGGSCNAAWGRVSDPSHRVLSVETVGKSPLASVRFPWPFGNQVG